MRYIIYITGGLAFLAALAASAFKPPSPPMPSFMPAPRMFSVESIDTMKYSRDLALQEINNPSFDATITEEMSEIKATGANYVAIGTPYDSQFSPILTRWVNAARAAGLSVWFRGNFSGWEGWFNYATITPAEHSAMLNSFILDNPNLFQNGDIFTPCPECENGGPGDPRQTGDVAGYRNFLIDEAQAAEADFNKIGKKVTIYDSMNADVAKVAMDPATANALGSTVLIDHYVSSPDQFGSTIISLASTSQAEVGLGEFGAPIPNLNGNMTESQQADFVGELLNQAFLLPNTVPVINYWDLQGGSTALVNDDGSTRRVYDVIKSYYDAPAITGTVTDTLGDPLPNISISVNATPYSQTQNGGEYEVFLPESTTTITFAGDGYTSKTLSVPRPTASTTMNIVLEPLDPSVFYNSDLWLKSRL